jgi:hypothetical protein
MDARKVRTTRLDITEAASAPARMAQPVDTSTAQLGFRCISRV